METYLFLFLFWSWATVIVLLQLPEKRSAHAWTEQFQGSLQTDRG
jgi:hypothetical protein